MTNNNIHDVIKESAKNEFNVPMFTYDEWQSVKQRFTTEGEIHPGFDIIFPAIRDYIRDNKPPIPIKRPTDREMSDSFHGLLNLNSAKCVDTTCDKESIRNKFDEIVDVEHIISASHTWNDVSNHFHSDNRYTCGWHSKRSNAEIWKDPMSKDFRSLIMYLWRTFKGEFDDIDHAKYRAGFRLSGYVATQFKPLVAKTVYEYHRAKRVVDISCGWGDRLAGFYTSTCTEDFLGCDPNPQSYEIYKKQCLAYEEQLQTPLFPVDVTFEDHGTWFEVRGTKRVRIYNLPAEDMDWDNIVEDRYDLMFTSPPYFGIERYAEGQEGEDNQSWKKYGEYEMWRDSFYFPVLDNLLTFCDTVLVNIVDPVVKNKRYRLEDDMRGRYAIPEVYGMKMSRRPSGVKDSDHGVVDDKKLNFIEPVYKISYK
jgi:hypothetical protein